MPIIQNPAPVPESMKIPDLKVPLEFAPRQQMAAQDDASKTPVKSVAKKGGARAVPKQRPRKYKSRKA